MVSSGEFGKAHYNKKRNNRNLGKRGSRKREKPRKGPCVRIVLHILILFSLASLWILLFLRPSFYSGLGGAFPLGPTCLNVYVHPWISLSLRTIKNTRHKIMKITMKVDSLSDYSVPYFLLVLCRH